MGGFSAPSPSTFRFSVLSRSVSLAFCTYCSTSFGVCQEGIFLFADFFYSVYLVTHLGVPCGDFPLDTLIVPHSVEFVKGLYQLFFRASSVGFEPLGSGPSLQPRWDSPLDNYSIAFREAFVKSFFHTFRNFFSLAL